MTTGVKNGMDFWWNWNIVHNVDESTLSPDVVKAVKDAFVPMLWGQSTPPSYDFLNEGSHVMGYNEPDQYGPACVGDWNPPAYGCSLIF